MPLAGSKKINYCLDFIKGIACIFVVLMHCEFPGKLGIIVQCISRFCVPFFFMVSGYFSFYQEKRSTLPKIKHILKIILGVCIFYYFVAVLQNNVNISLDGVIRFILFNEPIVIAGQMWFLFALLYVYLIYTFVNRFSIQAKIYIAIPILIIAYIV